MRELVVIGYCVFAVAACAPQSSYIASDEDVAEVTAAAAAYMADHVGATMGVADTTWTIDPGRTQLVGDPSPQEELETLVGFYPDSISALMTEFYNGDIPSYRVSLPVRDDVIRADSLDQILPAERERRGRFIAFARLAFDPTGTWAALGVDRSCTPTHRIACGNNDLLLLKKRPNGWTVVELIPRWVS